VAVFKSLRAVVAGIAAVLPAMVFGQTKSSAPIQTTLCAIVKEPQRFNGQLIELRAEYVSKFEWIGLKDETCSASIPIGAFHVLDDLKPVDGEYAFITTGDELTHPDKLKWKRIEQPRRVRLVKDQKYQQLRKYADAKFRWPDGGECIDCPLYRITATVTGRFEYFQTQTVAVRANSSAKPYSYAGSNPSTPLFRFVLQSVSDISAISIDPAVYSASNRRTITLEEANDLVYAYLAGLGCNKGRCELDEFHDPGAPDFYVFQALSHNPKGSPNLGFFAVDPGTGGIWNTVICERITSTEVVKLQRIIHQRIGLSEAESRNAARRGPMCDPGETIPVRPSK
jgi:hypothetical protein